ncbi:MAG: efflux RND transporter periplasmic adaptor subunit [Myxococcales bacterium]|nr:efflux RND transporter periplasmic adaptor subunit [Myxococcales bacterium]
MHRLARLCVIPFVVFPFPACEPAVQAAVSTAVSDEAELEPVTTTQFGEHVLLFMENPPLVRGESARFLAHFSVLATGEPIRAGRVDLVIGSTSLRVDAPKRDGLFTPEASFPDAGRWPVHITVTSDQAVETLDLGEVIVHADTAAARAAGEAEAGEDAASSIPFLMEQQWKVKLLLAPTRPAHLTQRLVVPARLTPAEGSAAVVTAPISGRLLAPPESPFPRRGETVERGRTLALVEPLLTAAEATQLQALRLEFDLRRLDLEQTLADARARVRFAEIERDRLSGLRTSGLATQQQLDGSERDLALASVAVTSAESAQAALDAIHARQASSPIGTDGTLRFAVPAPIGGVLAETGRVVGEAVEAGDPLFRIVDGSQLWIEARVSEFDIASAMAARDAVAVFSALPGVRVPLRRSGAQLLALAPEVDATTHTVVVRGVLADGDPRLLPGMLSELEIGVASVDAAVVIPFEAIVMDQGLPVAYVMHGGESFDRRDLVLGVRDGDFVEVVSGVAPGEHVATRGASTIRMAAMSPAAFGPGHAH